MRHHDYDVALLVSLFDVVEGLRYSLQGKFPIDDRPERAGRNKFGDVAHSRRAVHGHTALHLLAADNKRPQHPYHAPKPHDVLKKSTAGLQRVSAPAKTSRADDVEYQVI